MAIIRLPDADIFYELHGSGKALVLIPGFASGGWSWEWQADDLAEIASVIKYDPRGIARSKVNGDVPVTISKLADDIAALLDHTETARAHILGISFGGFVAQDFAVRYPERLDKLILASTSFGGPKHVLPPAEVLEPFSAEDGLNSSERIRKHLRTAFLPDFLARSSSEVERFCELREKNEVPESVYREQLESAYRFNIEGQVAGIRAGTLVVTGDRDSVVPKQNSYNLAAKLPNARLEVIENAGHMVFIEKMAEFNKVVKDFLTE